ncbi:hypothetical protein CYY_010013 [Polysphondylium violaceum]|uniref:Ras-associating domain-containing protein n=1 Tax=Polysphondylium violaceum TaxID=133409 RepID=A0A8J4PKI7_9MYCE|nr:hypothetical protein CYY_010013 [Polysphondylium violaceum]
MTSVLGKFDYELLRSAADNDIKKLREMLDCGVDINMTEFEKGTTALHIACSRGHKQAIELLVSRGADLNIQDNRGVTALYSLVTNRYDILALWLIRKGANMNLKDRNGFTAFDMAQRWFQKEMVDASEGRMSNSEESVQQQKQEMEKQHNEYLQQKKTILDQHAQSQSSPPLGPVNSGLNTFSKSMTSEVLKIYFRNDSYKSVKINYNDTARDVCKLMCEKFNMASYDKCFDVIEVIKGQVRYCAPTEAILQSKLKWPTIVGLTGNETHLNCHFSIVIRKTAPQEAHELFGKV